jgi:hypothetical protein
MFLFLVYLAFVQTENSVVETKKIHDQITEHIVPQSPRLIFLDEMTGRGAFAGIILFFKIVCILNLMVHVFINLE